MKKARQVLARHGETRRSVSDVTLDLIVSVGLLDGELETRRGLCNVWVVQLVGRASQAL